MEKKKKFAMYLIAIGTNSNVIHTKIKCHKLSFHVTFLPKKKKIFTSHALYVLLCYIVHKNKIKKNPFNNPQIFSEKVLIKKHF